MSASLRPMREDELPAFLEHAIVDYARDMAEHGGLGTIELNVFGGNEVARSPYRSLGYEEAAVTMAKSLP